MVLEPDTSTPGGYLRRVAYATRGCRHSEMVRLAEPKDVGALTRPFVGVDCIDLEKANVPNRRWRPYSGVAMLLLVLKGRAAYADSTGQAGVLRPGSVGWLQAAGGAWRCADALSARLQGIQLMMALPPALENAPASSLYLGPDCFPRRGPARVLLGDWAGVRGPIPAPSPMTCLDVLLDDGQSWSYAPPPAQDIAWLAVHQGRLAAPQPVVAGELVVYEEGCAAIDLQARGPTRFLLGSAVRHPHELVLGTYSVHTSLQALDAGEDNIRRIARELNSHPKVPGKARRA